MTQESKTPSAANPQEGIRSSLNDPAGIKRKAKEDEGNSSLDYNPSQPNPSPRRFSEDAESQKRPRLSSSASSFANNALPPLTHPSHPPFPSRPFNPPPLPAHQAAPRSSPSGNTLGQDLPPQQQPLHHRQHPAQPDKNVVSPVVTGFQFSESDPTTRDTLRNALKLKEQQQLLISQRNGGQKSEKGDRADLRSNEHEGDEVEEMGTEYVGGDEDNAPAPNPIPTPTPTINAKPSSSSGPVTQAQAATRGSDRLAAAPRPAVPANSHPPAYAGPPAQPSHLKASLPPGNHLPPVPSINAQIPPSNEHVDDKASARPKSGSGRSQSKRKVETEKGKGENGKGKSGGLSINTAAEKSSDPYQGRGKSPQPPSKHHSSNYPYSNSPYPSSSLVMQPHHAYHPNGSHHAAQRVGPAPTHIQHHDAISPGPRSAPGGSFPPNAGGYPPNTHLPNGSIHPSAYPPSAYPSSTRPGPPPPPIPTQHGYPIQPSHTPPATLQKSAFLAPFEKFYDALLDSRTLQTSLTDLSGRSTEIHRRAEETIHRVEEHHRRCVAVLNTLQASSTSLQEMVRQEVEVIRKETRRELGAVWGRVKMLEEGFVHAGLELPGGSSFVSLGGRNEGELAKVEVEGDGMEGVEEGEESGREGSEEGKEERKSWQGEKKHKPTKGKGEEGAQRKNQSPGRG